MKIIGCPLSPLLVRFKSYTPRKIVITRLILPAYVLAHKDTNVIQCVLYSPNYVFIGQ